MSLAGSGEALRELSTSASWCSMEPGARCQGAGLTAADYRGERSSDHPQDATGDPDLLDLTCPDVVLDMHRRHLAACADIITTNTFTATSVGQADYGLQPLYGR